jgi:hypothetical protein
MGGGGVSSCREWHEQVRHILLWLELVSGGRALLLSSFVLHSVAFSEGLAPIMRIDTTIQDAQRQNRLRKLLSGRLGLRYELLFM